MTGSSSTPPVTSTGDGSRPTTSGGTDNIGKGEQFTGKRTAGGDVAAPANKERMSGKRKDKASVRHDDSDPMGLHEDPESEPNRESP